MVYSEMRLLEVLHLLGMLKLFGIIDSQLKLS